jgi:hypothetical protein
MGGEYTRSNDKAVSEVTVLANLREWRNRFNDNPLDPEVITEGLLTLSEIGESALVQAVRYGLKVEEVLESQSGVHETLDLIHGKLDTAISRFEGASSVHEHENESVAVELKRLDKGMQEVKNMAQAIIDHFGIRIPG